MVTNCFFEETLARKLHNFKNLQKSSTNIPGLSSRVLKRQGPRTQFSLFSEESYTHRPLLKGQEEKKKTSTKVKEKLNTSLLLCFKAPR